MTDSNITHITDNLSKLKIIENAEIRAALDQAYNLSSVFEKSAYLSSATKDIYSNALTKAKKYAKKINFEKQDEYVHLLNTHNSYIIKAKRLEIVNFIKETKKIFDQENPSENIPQPINHEHAYIILTENNSLKPWVTEILKGLNVSRWYIDIRHKIILFSNMEKDQFYTQLSTKLANRINFTPTVSQDSFIFQQGTDIPIVEIETHKGGDAFPATVACNHHPNSRQNKNGTLGRHHED
ncbi:hypothetical protein DLAC_10281 [Tieghemostelium lacteum]|uniref:Uncharacterized protein n=1 Tax=Tieghemostelium lacteum TaxID=361077 RepID=A0A151Z540_TIELA|nr:hypothetical protein DLAC_10281 [Tieghemostelium lacteum]|eukprot:KYQ89055.1 hypothetical protein DLAC_10281 [Tieghemostelium lacteum]